jgi:hypothetical protein
MHADMIAKPVFQVEHLLVYPSLLQFFVEASILLSVFKL